MKREIYDNLCAADNQDLPLEDYPDRILSVVERYIHPAPDALRAAVAKLEKAKITDDPAEVFMLAMEALAALQAEGAN